MGRPRKNVINEAMTKPKRQYIKKVKPDSATSVKILQEQVEQLTELLSSSIESQLESYQVSVEAEDKFRELAKEIELSLNSMRYHCEQVQKNTGSLTLEDVNYCISLGMRIIENKFKKA